MSNQPKVRLAGGPHISPEMHADLAARVKQNNTSFGIELERDWLLAREARKSNKSK